MLGVFVTRYLSQSGVNFQQRYAYRRIQWSCMVQRLLGTAAVGRFGSTTTSGHESCVYGNEGHSRLILLGTALFTMGISNPWTSRADSITHESHPDPVPATVNAAEFFEEEAHSIDNLPEYTRYAA